MLPDTDTTIHTVHAAVIAAHAIGYGLGLAVGAAMWDALVPTTLTLTPEHLGSWLRFALSAIALVTGVKLLWRILVTHGHTYTGHTLTRHGRLPEDSRRRMAGSGRRFQGAGRHRAS